MTLKTPDFSKRESLYAAYMLFSFCYSTDASGYSSYIASALCGQLKRLFKLLSRILAKPWSQQSGHECKLWIYVPWIFSTIHSIRRSIKDFEPLLKCSHHSSSDWSAKVSWEFQIAVKIRWERPQIAISSTVSAAWPAVNHQMNLSHLIE